MSLPTAFEGKPYQEIVSLNNDEKKTSIELTHHCFHFFFKAKTIEFITTNSTTFGRTKVWFQIFMISFIHFFSFFF
jgi:hypothetical protein